MPECHTCPHDGKGSRACLRCPGARDDRHSGRSHISLDACDELTRAHIETLIPGSGRRRRSDRDRMVDCMRMLFEMDDRDFRLIRWRFLHPDAPLSGIARRFRLTTQGVHYRLKLLAEAWPGVAALVGLTLRRRKK